MSNIHGIPDKFLGSHFNALTLKGTDNNATGNQFLKDVSVGGEKYRAPVAAHKRNMFSDAQMNGGGGVDSQRIGGSFGFGKNSSINFKATGSVKDKKIYGGGLGFRTTF